MGGLVIIPGGVLAVYIKGRGGGGAKELHNADQPNYTNLKF